MNQTLEKPVPMAPPVAAVPVPCLWLCAKDVGKLLSLGQRTVWRMVANGQLPQPHRFNHKLVRWDRAELHQFVEDLRTARQAKEGRS